MNYFVTGATGFIGRHLVEELLKRDGTIYALGHALVVFVIGTIAIFVGEERHYGAVPGIGDHVELPKAPRAKSLKS